MANNELTSKFVKAHYVNTSISTQNSLRWLHKLLYEFWGFCVNGSNDLLMPGGLAPVSGVLFTGQWQSGSAVLLASGTDGQTYVDEPFFTASSVNWTSGSMNNKWLVMWKSGSSSTDDSIYPITQIINSSTIRVDTNTGGSPHSASLRPTFTSRSNINFRVVDFSAATSLSGFTADSDGLVLQLNGAYLVNSGQIAPQVRTRVRTSVGSNLPNVGLTLSSSGSWTPASSSGYFIDGTAEISANTDLNGWCNGSTGTGYITLIGAHDYLLCHMRGTWQTAGSGFHIEVPQRLYPAQNDPNPIVVMNYGVASHYTTDATQNYGGGFFAFHPPTNETRRWRTMIRSLTGDYFNANQYPSNTPNNVTNGRYNEMFFNVQRNKFFMFELACGRGEQVGQFSALRFKLRRVRWLAKIMPINQRFGDFGEWIHTTSGIAWPWDNSILPYNLLARGL